MHWTYWDVIDLPFEVYEVLLQVLEEEAKAPPD